jgi:hypothetical protein
MRYKRNKKLYVDSLNINQVKEEYPDLKICNICPLAYIMQITRFDPFYDTAKDASIYLNPLIED